MEACNDFVIICEHFLMRKVAAEMCLCMYIRVETEVVAWKDLRGH